MKCAEELGEIMVRSMEIKVEAAKLAKEAKDALEELLKASEEGSECARALLASDDGRALMELVGETE